MSISANSRLPEVKVDPRFLKGLHLFNEKDYFECHEVIEELWLATPSSDPHRDLYKGVIQAAASLYQFDRGILSGAHGLYRTSVGYLKKYEPSALGLNVERLVTELNAYYDHPNKQPRPVLEYESSPSTGMEGLDES